MQEKLNISCFHARVYIFENYIRTRILELNLIVHVCRLVHYNQNHYGCNSVGN